MAETSNAPTATSATAPVINTAPPVPPQRQSCDRCHRQKLRCTREKNRNGGVCDRCLGKRVQCVYSFSLPKGRPSSFRRADESTNRSTNGIKGSETGEEMVQRTALPANDENDVNTTTKTIIDTTRGGAPATNEHSVLADPMDTSKGASLGMWPQPKTLEWDDTQLGADWNGHESGQLDAVFASADIFGDGISAQEELIGSPLIRLHNPQSPRPPSLIHSEPESGNFERYGCTTRSHPEVSMRTGSDDMTAASSGEQLNCPNSVIAQLSELSTCLSTIRHSSSTLAKAALSSSYLFHIGTGAPLIDAAAFKSVGAWLAHDYSSINSRAQTSIVDCTKNEGTCPTSTEKTESRAGHGILHDVFSASHRMLEILCKLQTKTVVEPFSSSTANSVSKPSTAWSDQNGLFTGLTEGPWSSTLPYGSQPNSTHTTQIIRHLVMACEALLLGIYMAVLTALQHDVSHRASGNTTFLGDARLVMTVQLCSHLIERQHQGVDLYLASQGPISPASMNGTSAPKFSVSAPQQPVLPGWFAGAADVDVFSDIRTQLQGRLARLRQTLQCT